MDLVQFLRERLAEDKQIALAATWCEDAGTWHAEASEYGTPARPTAPRWYVEDSMDDGVITTVDPQASADEGVARHIAEWDPARVLLEVESRLAIVAAYLPPGGDPHPGLPCVNFEGQDPADRNGHDPCSRHLEASKRLLHGDYVLRLLSRPYRDHPDFDPTWLED